MNCQEYLNNPCTYHLATERNLKKNMEAFGESEKYEEHIDSNSN